MSLRIRKISDCTSRTSCDVLNLALAKEQNLTLHPERLSTPLRSSSKSSAVYLLCTLTWNTLSPFIQATKRDSVVLPAPDTPMSSRWPCGWRKIRSMRST